MSDAELPPELCRFYFGQPELLLVPIEALGDDRSAPPRLDARFRAEVLRRELASAARLDSVEAVLARVHAATQALAAAAPDYFPPPRCANLVVLREAGALHPYGSPFADMSVVMYADDFGSGPGDVDLAAFHYLVGERLAQTRRVATAVLAALPFLLWIDEAAAAALKAAAARSTRPDRRVIQRLAEELDRLRATLRCEGLAPGPAPEGYGRVRGTALSLPKGDAPALQALVKELDGIGEGLIEAHFERQRDKTGDPRAALLAFLRDERPRVLVVDREGAVLWDPARPHELDAVAAATAALGARPGQSLIADLRVVAGVTARFKACVRGADGFDIPVESLEEAGGVYVHQESRLLAYALEHPSFSPLVEEAPPFHRWLLAARAMHEWGHVAVEGGVIPVPARNEGAFAAAGDELAAIFSRIVNQLPREAQAAAEDELREMRDQGTRLVDLPFSRMEDWRANLLCKRLLPPECVESYVRVNVRPLVTAGPSNLRKLARYAYEAQYLWLSGMADPWLYLEAGSYFLEEYVLPGLVSHELARRLVACIGRVAHAFEVDEAQIDAARAASPLW